MVWKRGLLVVLTVVFFILSYSAFGVIGSCPNGCGCYDSNTCKKVTRICSDNPSQQCNTDNDCTAPATCNPVCDYTAGWDCDSGYICQSGSCIQACTPTCNSVCGGEDDGCGDPCPLNDGAACGQTGAGVCSDGVCSEEDCTTWDVDENQDGFNSCDDSFCSDGTSCGVGCECQADERHEILCNDDTDNDGYGDEDMEDEDCQTWCNSLSSNEDTFLSGLNSYASALNGRDGCCGDDSPFFSCQGTISGVGCDDFSVDNCPTDVGCSATSLICSGSPSCPSGIFSDVTTCNDNCPAGCPCYSTGTGGTYTCGNQFIDCASFSVANCPGLCSITTIDVCNGVLNDSCSQFTTQSLCDGWSSYGCAWELIEVDIYEELKDYAFFDSSSQYFCSNDYDESTGGIVYDSFGDWHWWDASEAGNAYKIHTIG